MEFGIWSHLWPEISVLWLHTLALLGKLFELSHLREKKLIEGVIGISMCFWMLICRNMGYFLAFLLWMLHQYSLSKPSSMDLAYMQRWNESLCFWVHVWRESEKIQRSKRNPGKSFGFIFNSCGDTPERFLDRLRAVGNFLNAKNSTNISLFLSYDDTRGKKGNKTLAGHDCFCKHLSPNI